MTIKDGFDSKPLGISVSTGFNSNTCELWIKQEGLPEGERGKETLSYPTLTELIQLRDELNKTIKTMAGV